MKQTKNKNVRKKYLVGTTIKSVIEDPSTALAQNNIDIANAQYQAASNPWVLGLGAMGQLTTQASQFFSSGGRVNKVPVEVEGGEAGELPNGQLLNFNGPSHGEGGIPIDLPEGTEIYSKRIKIEGESMADRKLKRESVLARYTKKAKKTGDTISSNTLKRVQRSVDIEDEEDKKIQQVLHDLLNGTLAPNGSTPREQHPFGGPITKYPNQEDESLQLSNTLLPDYLKTPLVSFDNPGLDMNAISSDITSKVNTSVKQSLLTPQKDISGNKFNLPITGGDALNIAGNVFQGVAPYLNTLNNRANDTPNVNSFKEYGVEAIDKMTQAENYLKQTFDSRLKEIGLKRSDAIKRGRNSSGSINLMRALDTNADMAGNDAENKAYDDYATQMINILGKEAQLENDQDRMVMQGEYQRDLADRQDKDNFSTAKGQGLRDIGMTVANAGKQVNDMKSRDTQFNLLGSMYESFGINPMTGEISGKIAKALNIPEGSVLKPNEIQDAISNGKFKSLGLDIKTVQDYYKKFGLTDPNPANNVISLGRTIGTTTKQGGK